ncbi:MAG: hypothetical protein [Bacteriophage sp.]|nr:MAG: hypothetical protein [Bacteriophage sp.]
MATVRHKKGDPAGTRNLAYLGMCRSYWAEDGWHDSETGNVVKAPLIAEPVVINSKKQGPCNG